MSCSLLVIPPPPLGRQIIQGDFPSDLLEINLSGWVSLVQDVAAGLQALPPELSNSLEPEAMTLLQWLEAVTQVGFCHLCYQLGTNCRCPGVSQLAPSWSHIAGRLSYGAATSTGVMTTPSASLRGMTGLVQPLPGLSIWDLTPWETLLPQQLAAIPSYKPSVGMASSPRFPTPRGRGKVIQMVLSRNALVPLLQITPAIRQAPPFSQGQSATPYVQAVQPSVRVPVSKVSFDPSATKPAPTGRQGTEVHGRLATRSQDDNRWQASCPRGDGIHPLPKEDMRLPLLGGLANRHLVRRVDVLEGPSLRTP